MIIGMAMSAAAAASFMILLASRAPEAAETATAAQFHPHPSAASRHRGLLAEASLSRLAHWQDTLPA